MSNLSQMVTRLSFNITQTLLPGRKEIISDVSIIGEYELIPVGLICLWSGAVADVPSGWALCDGTQGTPDLRDKFIIGAGATYDPKDTGGEASHDHAASSADDTHNHSASAADDTHSHAATAANDTHNHTASAESDIHEHYVNLGSHGHDLESAKTIVDSGPDGDFSHSTSSVSLAAYSRTDTHDHAITVDNDTHTHVLTVPDDTHSHTLTVQNDTHNHAVTVNAKATLPPYYALAYIMKL